MKEPFIEKINLLDTEYAQLLEKRIDPREYLEEKAVPGSRATLTKLKLTVAALLIMLFSVGIWAIHLLSLSHQPNNDTTTELKAKLIMEMQKQELLDLEQRSSQLSRKSKKESAK